MEIKMAVENFTYGSDASGLVWGYLFGRDASPLMLDTAAALEWLRQSDQQKPQEFIWLHFNLSNASCEKWLHKNLTLADEFYETLHEDSRTTRIELAENTLIGVVNDVLHDFSFHSAEISTLWVNVTEKLVISARRKPLQSIERLRQAVRSGEPIRSTVELLIHLLRDQADVLMKIVRDAVNRVDGIEDELLAERLSHNRKDLGTMRRVLVRLQRLLAPEPAALFRLLQRPPAWVTDLDNQELRESTEEFSVVLNDLSSLQERIKLLQEESAARVNEENGRSLFVLTIVTVLALPINIIAGLLGMNVGGIPLADNAHGFWVIVSIVGSFTVVAGYLLFRIQKYR
jgi:zinc transporter